MAQKKNNVARVKFYEEPCKSNINSNHSKFMSYQIKHKNITKHCWGKICIARNKTLQLLFKYIHSFTFRRTFGGKSQACNIVHCDDR